MYSYDVVAATPTIYIYYALHEMLLSYTTNCIDYS